VGVPGRAKGTSFPRVSPCELRALVDGCVVDLAVMVRIACRLQHARPAHRRL
jgi:hypothetical protein